MRLFLLSCLLVLGAVMTAIAQPPCPPGQNSVILSIRTDGYGYEISWQVRNLITGQVYGAVAPNTYANNQLYQSQVCVPDTACIVVEVLDTYGDGLLGAGYLVITYDGDTLANDPAYTFSHQVFAGCSSGQSCETATTVGLGQYTTSFDDHWYAFTPDSVGTYLITTCGLSNCDTKIWLYEGCSANSTSEDNAGTIFFDDDSNGCAPQAQVEGWFAAGTTYLIRIGDNTNACGDSITWELTYIGPVTGCTDPGSCNFNPLATIDDGSCLPQSHPDCPAGPDLVMRQDVLINSLQQGVVNSVDPCLIEEGCMRGYGMRDVVRFSTRIDNIGEKDYLIGQPSFNNNQFTWNNCHSHFHYDGYAEYILFSSTGERLPAGFKNGFCVLDLGCMWGSSRYGCNYMGISAGCYDEYWAGLSCQWIDVTDVADGDYTFVTRVNWDNAPDALGQLERDTINNWAQVCINIDRSSGQLVVTTDPNCPTYQDCAGQLYGPLVTDCRGECGGSALRGDLNENGSQEIIDATEYIDAIIAGSTDVTACNDLNADGRLSVYDASLLSSCVNFGAIHNHPGEGAHDHCNFPGGLTNFLDTVTLTLQEVNFEEGWLDIAIKNPSSRINAWQLRTSGVALTDVVSLVDPQVYPIAPRLSMADSIVLGISYQDSMINRSPDFQPLCRIFFSDMSSDFVCLAEAIDIVNERQEKTVVVIEEGCAERIVNSANEPGLRQLPVTVSPNPFGTTTLLQFPNPAGHPYRLEIFDANARLVRQYNDVRNGQVTIDRQQLSAGVYSYRLSGQHALVTGRLVIQ